MKHLRLKEHYENEVGFDRLHIFVLVPSIVFLVFGITTLMTGLLWILLGIVLTILGLAGVALARCFFAAARDYRYAEEDYIMVKIMDVIKEAVGSDDFEIIYSTDCVQKVAFHNVMVDYAIVQAKVDEELCIMNKIAHKDFRVKLL